MSLMNADDELVSVYLAESREHLAAIEANLLAIEQAGADIDEQLVNRVFRAAHSIKGGAGFFDLVKIRDLAHKTENVLDLIRSRQMVPTPEIVSVLLLAFDKLSQLLQNYVESNQADISEFVDALTALTTAHLPEERKQDVSQRVILAEAEGKKKFELSAFDLNQARTTGRSIYLLNYDLIHDVQRRGKTPLTVFKTLIGCGAILETSFDLDSAGTLDDEPSSELLLEVLYATTLEPDQLSQVIEVPPERVRLVECNVPATAAPKPAPIQPLQVSNPAPPAPQPVVQPAPPVPQAVAPTVAASPASIAGVPAQAPAVTSDTTIRLNVALLDSLMTLAGELVLSRNQLNESLARKNERGVRSGAQRVSLVTSELQEVVTQTRMQPVGSLFSKFPRLVRDLARELGKDVQIRMEGGEVEIDKTILEGLSDPLTHMVRNAVDHGIETPADRAAAGKPNPGTVRLGASHQAGQVVIEISDDGKGLDGEKVAASALAKGVITREQFQGMPERDKMALIFFPGVSTAQKVSDVSGRGVGMDVVKTNLDKLGGKIEIDSTAGAGTRFRIKLPLTLAIIPSLLVSDGEERFAIPQANVGELIRIPASQMAQRTGRVGDAEILMLRDRLVPLLHLGDVLGKPKAAQAAGPMKVVLVDAGAFEYGLVVEELHDTVEIVVKPLGRHLKELHFYAGATILGDGRVAVILDVGGLAARAGLSAAKAEALSEKQDADEEVAKGDMHAMLLFHNAPNELCAVPIEQVYRLERVSPAQVEYLGGRRTMQYRGSSLPIVTLHDAAAVGELSETQKWVVIIFERLGRPLGLLAAEPLNMVEATLEIDTVTLRQRGIAGSAVLKDKTILVLDMFELAESTGPECSQPGTVSQAAAASAAEQPTVLLAEDSDFFRSQIQRLMESIGCRVLAAEDGQAAWELLQEHAGEVDLVATDVEMPRMDGLALTRRIRADKRFSELPIVALTSLAAEEDIARGMAAGVTEYQVKLNKDDLADTLRKRLPTRMSDPALAESLAGN